MRILVVGSQKFEIEKRAECLRDLYPGSEVIAEEDSMYAVQYAFNHTVDALYTEIHMRPIDGFDVIRLVRQKNPGVLVYVLAETDAYVNRAGENRADGYYLIPTSVESLRSGNILRWERQPV